MKNSKAIFSLVIFFLVSVNANADPVCTEISRTCTSGAATRIINGTSVYKDCWDYSVNYSCYQAGIYTDNCSGIKQINGCTQLRSDCQSNLADGSCSSYKNKYNCDAEITNAASLNLTFESKDQFIKSDILDDSACSPLAQNPDCSIKSDSVCVEGAQTRIINGLAIQRDCWKYQKNYYCKGQLGSFVDNCTSYEDTCQLQNQSCISSDINGLCTYKTNTYQCQAPATQSSVTCGSQNYITYNKDTNFGKAAASLAVLQGAAQELNSDTLTTFTGSGGKCGKKIAGYSDCCKIGGFGQDVGLASCSAAEQTLAIDRGNKKCVYVGSYCSKKESLTNTCLEKKESYCCFSGKLARIIHEQGRPQIGMSWGSPENPNCAGISIEDLQKIDFDKIDFSELYADFENQAKSQLPSDQSIQDKVSSTVKNYYKDQ